MEEAEKMASLKKAYADIILNMAQESAARILVSERKALGFQQSLFAAKDEALSTLLRLKTIMESKIKEAEKASMGQVRRIHELESQLNEAEDTIDSLRTELKRMNDKLEKTKNLTGSSDVENMNTISCEDNSREREISSHSALCYPLGSEQISTDKEDTSLNQPAANDDYCVLGSVTKAEEMGAENECSSKPDLASIIMRSKEPELYRNGCTQRIRALEQNLLIKTDNQPNLNCELIEPENGKPERTCSVDTTKKGKLISGSEDCVESEEFDQKNRQVVKFFRRFSSGKQRKDCHIIPTHCGGTKISGEDEIVGCGKSPFQVVGEEPEKISCAPISPVITKCSKRPKTRKVQSKTSLRNEIIGLPKSDKQRITRLKFKEKSHFDLENQTSGNLSCEFGGKHGGDVEEPLLLTAKAVNISGDQNNESHKPHMENLILPSPEKEVVDNIDISTCDLKIEKNDVPYIYSNMKEENACESSGAPQQVGSDKFLKYTFRRKRKRGSSDSNNQDIFPEITDPTKRRTEDKIDILESQKPVVMVESTRDSRRMAQVARQLISLSEKRWW